MANPEGTPIWYELMTKDPAASVAFYEEVVGWRVHAPQPGDPKGYRGIDTGNGQVGGMLPLDDAMCAGGARPTWLFYVGVEDVDATTKKVEGAGGKVLMPPFDIPHVGRIAMVADPQGIPFYVMRGASEESSTAFERFGMGKCNWNELSTPDQAAANAFYAKVLGWSYPDKMTMPGGADYVFAAVGDARVGATMQQSPGGPRGWQFYFRVPDIDAAAERVKKAGGKVHAGPMDIPGGDRALVASDPHGVAFGLAAPGTPAK
jgi:predicted enzyme related to lactoylglutathione lyase